MSADHLRVDIRPTVETLRLFRPGEHYDAGSSYVGSGTLLWIDPEIVMVSNTSIDRTARMGPAVLRDIGLICRAKGARELRAQRAAGRILPYGELVTGAAGTHPMWRVDLERFTAPPEDDPRIISPALRRWLWLMANAEMGSAPGNRPGTRRLTLTVEVGPLPDRPLTREVEAAIDTAARP